jgi:NADH-quinone oxidoreductase subunit N
VYQGAPTPVTGFMAACTKIAAFIGLMRVFYVALGGSRWDWAPMMWIVAILTMVVGSIVALTQTDVKRMLAYSSIAHAGFLLTAFVGLSQAGSGVTHGITSTQAVLFYLVCYGFPTIGAFALVTLVRDAGGEATHLSRWAGLGKKSPLLAGIFAFFLLGFAGIPLTAGFTGKWAVFTAAWTGGAWPLVVVAVLCSLVAAFFYVRVIVLMFFSDLPADAPDVALPGWQTTTAVALGLAATVVLGIVPGPVLDLAARAGEFIR